ncbi:MAG: hypothetical protein HKM87_01600 [Ignavibacteriaceae bacterium]|nr:hypothetical protein [Ignavibacteriaceae bacterium]
MEIFYDLIRFFHVISFVFMCVLLFNLIVANERILLGISFNYDADRHIENIIKSGVNWCYINQLTILFSGLLLLVLGDIGIEALWTEWIVLSKTIIIFILMGTISYVHFKLQPKIESFLTVVTTGSEVPDDLILNLKPYRILRKWMTSFYLFLVIAAIVLGIQVYATFNPLLTIILIGLAGLFSIKADKILIRFGWI